MTARATVAFTLDEADFRCICDMAGYSMNGWASECCLNKAGDKFRVRFYKDTPAGEIEQTVMVSLAKLERTIAKTYAVPDPEIKNEYFHEALRNLISGEGTAGLGSVEADMLIQLAAFGELVYG